MLPGALKCSPRETRRSLDCEPPRWCCRRPRLHYLFMCHQRLLLKSAHTLNGVCCIRNVSSPLDGQHERVLKFKNTKNSSWIIEPNAIKPRAGRHSRYNWQRKLTVNQRAIKRFTRHQLWNACYNILWAHSRVPRPIHSSGKWKYFHVCFKADVLSWWLFETK
jgi:hypothetical protein